MTFGSGCLATGVGVFILDGFLVRGGTAAMHRNASNNSFHTLQLNFNLIKARDGSTLPGFVGGLGCAESFSKDGENGVDCE